MGKRGPKPKGIVIIQWSSNFAYAIGLLAADGSLSKDGRHISFVSKDKIQVENIIKALALNYKPSKYKSAKDRFAYRIQIGDILFYKFLMSIGFAPAKSLIIRMINIPNNYFFDFIRGMFDGDGSIHSYYDKRWKCSFMFYLSFTSASKTFIKWLQNEIGSRLGICGSITNSKGASWYQLKYAKKETQLLIAAMYKKDSIYLPRKKLKIMSILAMMGQPQKDSCLNARVSK